jgi:carboxyl-terminal processing protease
LPPRSWGIAGRLAAAGGLALLALSVVRLVELHALRTAATFPPELRRQERELDLSAKSWPEAFGALCADLAARYPFTAWKGIDWRERCAAAAPRIAAAAARHDARSYYRALRELAWSVPDGHVDLLGDDLGLESQETGGDFGLRLVQLDDGRVVACQVSAGGAAERAGLRYGAELLSWNGTPIEQALARTPVLWADWPPATAAARRAGQLRFLARAPAGARAAVTFRNRGGGRPVPATLAAASAPRRRGAQEAGKAGQGAREPAVEAAPAPPCEGGNRARFGLGQALAGGAVDWRWLAAGAGYIRIRYELPTLRQVDPAREVRRAVASFLDRHAQGIVLDVRGNSGGLDVMVPRAIGCFVAAPRIYEIPAVFDPAAGGFLAFPAAAVRALPSPPRFPGRVAVLIDGCTMSSGEGFPLALRGQPGVAVFGFTATAGFFAIGQRPIRLPGDLTFVVPVGRSLGADGRIQVDSDAGGRGGVAPDHRLRWTEATLDAVYRDHRDPVLEEALRWLKSGS